MKRLTTDEFIKKYEERYGEKWLWDKFKYANAHTKSIFTCKKHGDFLKAPSNLFQGQGCPMCAQSKLENEICNILKENNIDFEREKKFDALGLYRYDFYLPQKNILIECQGIQHFKKKSFFIKRTPFSTQLNRDKLKFNFAIKNNIKIIYFIKEKNICLQQEQFGGIYDEEKNVFKTSSDLLKFIKEN